MHFWWQDKARWRGARTQEPKEDGSEDLRLHRGWRTTLTLSLIVGFIVVWVYGSGQPQFNLGIAILLAGGCVMLGGLLGFLFGIPRALRLRERPDTGGQGAQKDEAGNRPAYRPNTNLEEVSDWLTKILVGVGLTQLNAIPAKVVAFGVYFGKPLGGDDVTGERFAAAVLLYFSVTGFLLGYLWTRLFLGSALARADEDAFARAKRKLDAVQLQARFDQTALALVGQQLQPRGGAAPPVSLEELRQAIGKASETVRIQILYQSEGLRRENWHANSTKPIMERTIPVFESLIEADAEKKYHQNWGQLGFALKDQRTPDWQKAETALTTAIRMRGDVAVEGFPQYEFNRAFCRIMGDPDFTAGTASKPVLQASIRADLKVAETYGLRMVMERTPDIAKWLTLNPRLGPPFLHLTDETGDRRDSEK
jgi:hypothetical protein